MPGKIRITSIAAVIATTAICLAAYLLSFEYLVRAMRDSDRGASHYARGIDLAVTRFGHLPRLLAEDPRILQALAGEDEKQLEQLDRHLSWVAAVSNVQRILLLDINGRAIAGSELWKDPAPKEELYTFRPDFRAALGGTVGTYFTVSPETGAFSYHVSAPALNREGVVFGVVSAMVSLDDVGRAWEDTGELVLLTNPQGVVLAASDREYLYGLLNPLNAYERRQLELGRQFGDLSLHVLGWKVNGPDRVDLEGETYVWNKAMVRSEPWTIHLLTDLRGIRITSLLVAAGLLVLALLIGLITVLFQSAQLREALHRSNEDRRRLREAQDMLARKNRLAALGQFSASITHELGQPIAAMRNYLVASEMEQSGENAGQNADLHGELTKLVERMGNIMTQLKSFSQPGGRSSAPFDILAAIEASIALVRFDAERMGVDLAFEAEPDLPACLGDQARFEQVIINLLTNALDAMAEQPVKRLSIRCRRDGAGLYVRVEDTGTGLGGKTLSDLQEPFFTTKASGKGMGLGLAISSQIVGEMGGTLRAHDAAGGGAVFEIRLRAAVEQEEGAG
ncbi:sensor histidine kinase [Paracoccus methylarcula]|uniref:sensor histidine kinase n=1 Tax=Paracoccus methylarcula TaxID=72022 RepID=UPI001473D503|nr:ATP-binding protein [Paracoccus methylarcula]